MKNWIYIIMIGLLGSLVSSCQQSLDEEVQESTIGKAVILSMESLLLEVLVSLSLDVTLTALAIVPFEITLATIVRFTVSPAFKRPIVHV